MTWCQNLCQKPVTKSCIACNLRAPKNNLMIIAFVFLSYFSLGQIFWAFDVNKTALLLVHCLGSDTYQMVVGYRKSQFTLMCALLYLLLDQSDTAAGTLLSLQAWHCLVIKTWIKIKSHKLLMRLWRCMLYEMLRFFNQMCFSPFIGTLIGKTGL